MDGQGLFGSGPVIYGCQGAAAFGGELFGKDRFDEAVQVCCYQAWSGIVRHGCSGSDGQVVSRSGKARLGGAW